MKLRISGDTIRIRIQQQELTDLEVDGFIQQETVFGIDPDNKLVYRLESSEDAEHLVVDYTHQCISIIILETPLSR